MRCFSFFSLLSLVCLRGFVSMALRFHHVRFARELPGLGCGVDMRHDTHYDQPHRSFWTLSGSPNLLAYPTFLSIAEANDITPEQTLYKLAQMQGIAPLSGTTSVLHMQQDLEVEKLELKEDEVKKEVEMVRKLLGE